MRTPDDLNPSPPWKPLGDRVEQPKPAAPQLKPVPGAKSGIVVDENGRMQTTHHAPGG